MVTPVTPSVLIFSRCANFLDFHNFFCKILLCFCAFLQNFANNLHIFAFFLLIFACLCVFLHPSPSSDITLSLLLRLFGIAASLKSDELGSNF